MMVVATSCGFAATLEFLPATGITPVATESHLLRESVAGPLLFTA